MRADDVNRLIEQAIQGHASTRDAIRWAMKQSYMDGVASGILAEREACAKVCEQLGMATNGMNERNYECAEAIRARGEAEYGRGAK
jgi:2-keto-3-deoxy-L-rhamnonate aldolase RhmA